MPGDPVGEQVTEWLRGALYDGAGRQKMSLAELMRRSGVHKGTLHPMLKGHGGEPDDTTLAKLARALGVPAPHIERRLTLDAVQSPQTPLALLRAAQGLLERLADRLEDEGDGQSAYRKHAPTAPAGDDRLSEAERHHLETFRKSQRPPPKRKRSNGG